jgi:hypothetical protein
VTTTNALIAHTLQPQRTYDSMRHTLYITLFFTLYYIILHETLYYIQYTHKLTYTTNEPTPCTSPAPRLPHVPLASSEGHTPMDTVIPAKLNTHKLNTWIHSYLLSSPARTHARALTHLEDVIGFAYELESLFSSLLLLLFFERGSNIHNASTASTKHEPKPMAQMHLNPKPRTLNAQP